MATRIAMFNHKGGVSKTTTTFNLAWMLADLGKTVLIVDTDPQCNLSGLALGYDAFEKHYEDFPHLTIKEALSPAFDAKPMMIEPLECVATKHDRIHLLPGDISLSEYEVTLGLSQEISGTVGALQNIPGAMNYLLDVTAERYDADYVFIDMSPSLSSINQNLLMTSEYFIVPASPDYFSVMAFRSLARTLPKWKNWAEKFVEMPFLEEAIYKFPGKSPKFLGTVIQNFRIRSGNPTRGYRSWIEAINGEVTRTFVPALQEAGMALSGDALDLYGMPADACIGLIPDFNTLMPKAQTHSVPVYALTDEQLQNTGSVLQQDKDKQVEFRGYFNSIAEDILKIS